MSDHRDPDAILDGVASIPTDDTTLSLAKREHDQSLMALEALKQSVEGFSGRILVRLPRSLHRHLSEAADIEGVSLNQYILYLLSR